MVTHTHTLTHLHMGKIPTHAHKHMLTHANTHTRKLHDTTTHMDTCRPCFFLFFEAKLTSNKLKSSDEEKSFIFCKRQIQARLWIKRNKKTASKISVFLTLLPLFLLLLYWHRINFLRNLMERVNQKPVLPFCWARHRSYKKLTRLWLQVRMY